MPFNHHPSLRHGTTSPCGPPPLISSDCGMFYERGGGGLWCHNNNHSGGNQSQIKKLFYKHATETHTLRYHEDTEYWLTNVACNKQMTLRVTTRYHTIIEHTTVEMPMKHRLSDLQLSYLVEYPALFIIIIADVISRRVIWVRDTVTSLILRVHIIEILLHTQHNVVLIV